jgi:signal transduction histidine kinase
VVESADDSADPSRGIRATWQRTANAVEIAIEDDGPGLASTANLFVPFFTTRQKGSGIGLVLCRQIAEAHGGSLSLENRRDGRGCIARLRLPTAPHASPRGSTA